MALAPDTRLGSYTILAPLGAGGMGEVYRAHDPKLDRQVAIKVLPEALARDADALARFEREAKAVAALSHPNILQIYDFGAEGSTVYAVMELLEGETLRDRLDGTPLPARKAAELARQVARGLGAAHDKGVVHRDLKPDNLIVTGEGRIKILDFGLARVAQGSDAGEDDATHTPTRTELTSPGTVMGTVGYMAPEQVRGQPADALSDIFSLGVVLYEMLSGRRAFQRDTAAETMTAILKEEPPEAALGAAEVPPGLQRIVQRCLEKRPEERFQSAHDLAFALESVSGFSASGVEAPSGVAAVADRRGVGSGWKRIAAAAALVAVGALIGFGAARTLRGTTEPEPVRVRSITFSGRDFAPAASPDGRLIAFSSDRDGRSRVWLKQLADGSEVALTDGTDVNPRFQPDGSSVLFARTEAETNSVYRIAVVGGEPRKLIDNATEADLSPDGSTLAFIRTGEAVGFLGVANADGSNARDVFTVENRRLFGARWSPEGDRIALAECPSTMNTACTLVIVDPASGERTTLFEGWRNVSPLTWTDTRDEIVYALADQAVNIANVQQWKLIKHDLRSGKKRSLFWTEDLLGGIEILAPGTLLFGKGSITQNLKEYRLEGGRTAARGSPITRGGSMDRQPIFAPDGETVIFSSNRTGNLDLWAASVATGAIRRLTHDDAADWDPGLTRDGSKLLWSSDRSGNLEIWIAEIDGSGARQITRDGVDAENPTATPDGEWIVYASGNPERLGVWKIRADGTEDTQLFSGPAFVPDTSPDGRYALYGISDPAQRAYYVRVVEVATGRPVDFEIKMTQRGAAPRITYARGRWMPDGRRIAFVGANESGRTGIYVQDFAPGRDTTSTRRELAGFEAERVTESFGISPSGDRVVLAMGDDTGRLVVAEGVPQGIAPPVRN